MSSMPAPAASSAASHEAGAIGVSRSSAPPPRFRDPPHLLDVVARVVDRDLVNRCWARVDLDERIADTRAVDELRRPPGDTGR